MEIHLTRELEVKLGSLAKDLQCSLDELVQQALDRYVEDAVGLAAEVREGEDSAEREGWLTTEEVFARLNQHTLKTA